MPFYGRLLFLIAIEGWITLSIQVLTIRQLGPFVGNNVVVTGTIIGFFLLFLALGYRKGGTYKDNYYKILSSNFMKAAALSGVGLSYIFIEVLFSSANMLEFPRLLTLLVYLGLVTSPLVYFLGQTIPIAVNMAKEGSIGEISGGALFLSTIGSFAGSIITAVILLTFVGVAATIFINFILLCILIWMVASEHGNKKGLAGNMVFLGMVVFSVNIVFEQQAFLETNVHANYSVINFDESKLSGNEEPNPGKAFIVNRSFSSFTNDKNKGWQYIEKIKSVLLDELQLKNKDILVLGAGGFTLSAEKTNDNRFTYVDIDGAIDDIAKESFIKNVNGKFVAEDARLYMASNKQKWHAIISDAYSNENSMPYHLVTVEHLQNIRKSLTHDGVAVFNIIGNINFSDAFTKRMDSTIRTVFSNCLASPIKYDPVNVTNIIYVCVSSENEEDMLVYTDNKNPSTIDYYRN